MTAASLSPLAETPCHGSVFSTSWFVAMAGHGFPGVLARDMMSELVVACVPRAGRLSPLGRPRPLYTCVGGLAVASETEKEENNIKIVKSWGLLDKKILIWHMYHV